MPSIKSIFLPLIFCVSLFTLNCSSVNRLIDKSGNLFVIEISTEKPNKDEVIDLAVRITQSRLNAIGVDGEVAKMPEKDNQISVKIYGSNDWERLKKFLFTTNQLELKKVVSPLSPATMQTFPTKGSAEKAAVESQEILPYSERYETNQSFVIVEKAAIVNGEDIRDAYAVSRSGSDSDYQIVFSLKKEAGEKFGEWTSKNIGNYLAIVLDKKVISAPFIKSMITDQGQIDGRFTKQSAEDIAISLKSGYLPATMKILEEKPFGN
jgi:preprotein translocase subunit SecD